MTTYEIDYAVARITNEIDGWYRDLEYWETANGGEPARDKMELCDTKIAELNERLNELLELA